MRFKFWFYVIKYGEYEQIPMGSHAHLSEIDNIISYWKHADYELHTFAGPGVQDTETGQVWEHKFTRKNQWDGIGLVEFPPPAPSIRPRSVIEI